MSAEALPALGPLLDSSGSDRYTLVGGDALIQSSLSELAGFIANLGCLGSDLRWDFLEKR